MPCFPRQIFSDTTNIPDKMVPSTTRPTAATRASSEREQASKLLKDSIDSFFLLSRNRTSLKSLKSYFDETRTVPCECREIVATIKQVKCCKGKHPKNTKLCNHRHRQRRCRHRLVQFSFVSESSARSVHIACHSVAGATSTTSRKFLPTFMLSLLGSSCDQ
jgi:hypothetical protein